MNWIVRIPGSLWAPEKEYVAQVVFGEFLGVEYATEASASGQWEVALGERSFRFPNLFFPEQDPSSYLTSKSLPRQTVRRREDGLPILFGRAEGAPSDVDWLGGVFFLLTRYEEAILADRDAQERFPASASLAHREGFLDRPLADEYVEEIWRQMQAIAPGEKRKARSYELVLSHDVDVPNSWPVRTPQILARRVAGDLLKRRSLSKAANSVRSYVRPEADPIACFDWMMSEAESAGLKTSFYFIPGGRHEYDPGYDPTAPFFKRLYRRILERGHEVGLHSSYETYRNPQGFQQELKRLSEASGSRIRGGRQHFLRFEVPTTWAIWDEAGLEYDSSLGFADQPGFRCGTCHEYPVFDLKRSKALRLRERPLVVMEHTLLSSDYLGLSHGDAESRVRELMTVVKREGGKFTLLWHNHNLVRPEDRELFRSLLRG